MSNKSLSDKPERSEPLGTTFLEFVEKRELRVPIFRATGLPIAYAGRYPPSDIEWRKASGRATLRSFTLIWNTYNSKKEVPYNVAWIQLEEGPLLISSVEVADAGDLSCGMHLYSGFNDEGLLVFLPMNLEPGESGGLKSESKHDKR